MKNVKKKNNEGFTLVELLAVIVILAIVTVLAAGTILPFMDDSKKNSFAIEANGAIDSASNAISLITIGSLAQPEDTVDFKYTKTDGNETYCFTIDWLVTEGLYKLDSKSLQGASNANGKNYQGKVIATKNENAYTYEIVMKNADLGVTNTGTVDKKDVKKASEMPVGSSYDCGE